MPQREEESKHRRESWLDSQMDRRTFLRISATLAAATALGTYGASGSWAAATLFTENSPDLPETDSRVKIIHSVCQMCHGRCGIQAKVVDGVLVKLDGNPYHPNNMDPDEMLPFATSPDAARLIRGRLCLKGHAGIQTLYDPYRLQGPIKRVGERGSGQWESVTWEEALDDIANRLLDLRDLTPPIHPDMDPDGSKIGPIANQVLYSPGRTVEGDLSSRIFGNGFGTANHRLDHTSICEADHHVANQLITDRRKNDFKPDFLNARFVLLFGSNPLEANFSMLAMARKLMEMRKRGGKYVVIDPRFSNSAALAAQWVPIIPGTDAALALALWIVDNERYDAQYLENANKAAANADGEKTRPSGPGFPSGCSATSRR